MGGFLMGRVIELSKIKKKNSFVEDIGGAILNNLYDENIKQKENNDYILIMKEIDRKKESIFKKRDFIIFELLLKYNKNLNFLVNLKWDDVDMENCILKVSQTIDIKICDYLVNTFIEYKNVKNSTSIFVFSDRKGNQVTQKFLKSLYNKYKAKTKGENQ